MALKFARLSRPAIRGLSPGEKIAEHGIIAECQKNGDIRYSVNVMVDGQRIHRVVGRDSDGVTREQAERYIEKVRTEARNERLDLPKGRKLHRSFSEAADDYIKRLVETDGKNLKPKRQHFKNHLKPHFGTQRIDRLSEFAIKQYRKMRRGKGASDATINRELATLSHMLRSAVAWKWIRADQVPVIEKQTEAQKPMAVLTDAQADNLMKGAVADQDGRLWLFVMFGLNAAMRHREILAVRYEHIDFEARRIFIPQAKAGEREQPITQALADALKQQQQMEKDSDGWVFPTAIPKQAKTGHRTNMARQFARAVERAKLDPSKVTPHTMRRTAITRLVRAGVDLPTIQRISGHKTLSMVLRYVHLHGDHIDSAMNALDRTISGKVTPELHTEGEGGGNERGQNARKSAAGSAA
ncbi:site-specific integrase [Rhizorhabdus sp.]|uniref:tyrosine-type recombinase/integrase n=1 Tax=Rhizorhabdus sp. TaxID=1968843 RepID=UPI0019ABA5B8|nr:site-specific integrase [Rhizorhabdus sp.]MBD3761464.1 site-specific integrase [Rhizorhabdus sp.]